MERITLPGGICLKNEMEKYGEVLPDSVSTLPDGDIDSGVFVCGNDCPMECRMTGQVKNGVITNVRFVYSGGNCIQRT